MRLFEQLVGPLRRPPVTTPYPAARASLPDRGVRGLPVRRDDRCGDEQLCMVVCPTGAIGTEDSSLDYGRCVLCGECVRSCAYGAMTAVPDFELAVRDRSALARGRAVAPGPRSDEDELRRAIGRGLGRSLHVRHLDTGSCNGCDWEIAALLNPYHDVQRFGIDFVASPRHADLLLVTGTMTRNLELAAVRTYEAMPEPRLVVAMGACAIGGSVFAGSYAARDGIGGEEDRAFEHGLSQTALPTVRVDAHA